MFRAVFGKSGERSGAPLAEVRRGPSFGSGLFAVALLALCSACAAVKPYERGKLAHPTMQLGDLARPAEAHVNAVHEGATGGEVGASSGCGCN